MFNDQPQLYCVEARYGGYNLAGKFCKEIEKGSEVTGGSGWQWYQI